MFAVQNVIPDISFSEIADISVLGENIAYAFERLASGRQLTYSFFRFSNISTLVLWTLCSVLMAAGFIRHFKKYRAENAGDVSDSLFSYRFFIPAIGICSLFGVSTRIGGAYMSGDLASGLATVVFVLIGYFVYRRTFRIKAEDITTVLACFSLVFIV